MPTKQYKVFYKILFPALFSLLALHQYIKLQMMVVCGYMKIYHQQCQESNSAVDLRIAFRSMAAAASPESFLGQFLYDEMRENLIGS